MPLRLLGILAENSGEVVTREELQKRLWPGNTFVDFEDGLHTAVRKLREALCDDPEKPRYVGTVPRRGYRFIAAVEIRNGGNGTPIPQTDLAAPKPATTHETASRLTATPPGSAVFSVPAATRGAPAVLRRRAGDRVLWQIRSVSGGAIATAAFLLWWYTPLPPPQVTRVDHLTTTALIDTPVKLVSDGARLYYMERDGDHWNPMETAVSGGEGRSVEAGATSAQVFDISPDFSGLLIGSFEVRGELSRLWTIPGQGGAPMRLGDATASSAVFSPDGKQIAYLNGSNLWMMDETGRTPACLRRCPGRRSGSRGLRMGKRFDLASRGFSAAKGTRFSRSRVTEGIFTSCFRTGPTPGPNAVAPGLPTVAISFSLRLAAGDQISGPCAKKDPGGAAVREAHFS